MGCRAKGKCVIDPNLPKGDPEKNPYCRFALKHEDDPMVGCIFWHRSFWEKLKETLARGRGG